MSENTRDTRKQMETAQRPKRVPIHEQKRDFLVVREPDPNTHYRIVNDRDNRIEKFKLAGYKVSDKRVDLGEKSVENHNVAVGTGTQVVVDKSGQKAVLMEIPKEYFEADQKAKQRQITESERTMRRRPKSQGLDVDEDEVAHIESLGTRKL